MPVVIDVVALPIAGGASVDASGRRTAMTGRAAITNSPAETSSIARAGTKASAARAANAPTTPPRTAPAPMNP